MKELQKQFEKENGLSFDGIPINGVHLEYITWLEGQIQTLRTPNVVERNKQSKIELLNKLSKLLKKYKREEYKHRNNFHDILLIKSFGKIEAIEEIINHIKKEK